MLSRHNAQIRLEVDALCYLLDRNEQLGGRTVAGALELLKSARPEEGRVESRKIGRVMVTRAIVYD
jgi:hypothetical protein